MGVMRSAKQHRAARRARHGARRRALPVAGATAGLPRFLQAALVADTARTTADGKCSEQPESPDDARTARDERQPCPEPLDAASEWTARHDGPQALREAVTFDPGSDVLTATAQSTLRAFIARHELAQAAPTPAPAGIDLIGHAGAEGSECRDPKLARRRAQTVRAFLEANGTSAAPIRVLDTEEHASGDAPPQAGDHRVDLSVASDDPRLATDGAPPDHAPIPAPGNALALGGESPWSLGSPEEPSEEEASCACGTPREREEAPVT